MNIWLIRKLKGVPLLPHVLGCKSFCYRWNEHSWYTEKFLLNISIVHFTSNRQIYIQVDEIAMGSSLAPLLAGIFMIKLESSLFPNLCKTKFWRRSVHDAICFVKTGPVEYLISVLNSFHKNIKLTYEVERNIKLPFLDVLLTWNDEDITTIYQKESNSDFYLHWVSFKLILWMRDTETFSWKNKSDLANLQIIWKKTDSY